MVPHLSDKGDNFNFLNANQRQHYLESLNNRSIINVVGSTETAKAIINMSKSGQTQAKVEIAGAGATSIFIGDSTDLNSQNKSWIEDTKDVAAGMQCTALNNVVETGKNKTLFAGAS